MRAAFTRIRVRDIRWNITNGIWGIRMAKGWLAAGIVAALLGLSPPAAGAVTVFAAASLSDALGDIGKAYAAKSGAMPVLSFAASSTLARQIEASRGVDIFISAHTHWMDYLDNRGLTAHETRK